MLPTITLNSSGLDMSKQRVQPVQLRAIPSSKTEAELEQLEKNTNQITDNAKLSSIGSLNSVTPASKATETATQTANPERLRFDTYEPSKPMASAGIYEPTVDENGNRTVVFESPDKQPSAMLYELSEQEAEKVAPSNLSVNVDKSSSLDDRSLLKIASDTRGSNLNDMNAPEPTGTGIGFGANKEKSRVDMLNNELAQAAEQMNLVSKTSISETMFS